MLFFKYPKPAALTVPVIRSRTGKAIRLGGTSMILLANAAVAFAEGANDAPKSEVLFGNQWLALAAILAGVAVFTALVGLLGRWLAATHPDEKK